MRSKLSWFTSSRRRSATNRTPREHVTSFVDSTDATVTSVPALRRRSFADDVPAVPDPRWGRGRRFEGHLRKTSIMMTASISSDPFATGTSARLAAMACTCEALAYPVLERSPEDTPPLANARDLDRCIIAVIHHCCASKAVACLRKWTSTLHPPSSDACRHGGPDKLNHVLHTVGSCQHRGTRPSKGNDAGDSGLF